jgi:hypothetical protein
MPITFEKRVDGTAWADFSASWEEGLIDSMSAVVTGRLFSQTNAPRVNDIIIFEKSEALVTRVQGMDVPTWVRQEGSPPEPVTHVFACSKGTAKYLVTALNQDDSITVLRMET